MTGNVVNNMMLGRYYTFFLNNFNLSDSYYMYQFYSPKLSKDLIPYLSLDKISEKTKNQQFNGQGRDILASCIGTREDIDRKGIEYIDGIIRRDDMPKIVAKNNGTNFPLIEPSSDHSVQKNLIISLRDSLRWKNYRFFPDRFVDILWTPYEFIVFKIDSDKDSIWLSPVNAYKNNDPELINPLDIDLTSIDYGSIKSTKWNKSGTTKASEINQLIKRMEWKSFDRRALTKKIS